MGWEFIAERSAELILRTREHLFLTGVSAGIAVITGIPLGLYVTKRQWLKSFLFGTASVVQTVPSLAMLAFLLALTGKIGVVPAIIALTLYAFLPIIQNTVTGLEGVSPEIVEASEGMGMTSLQRLRLVELPLASPVIIAGVKTAAVISVGIATLSAFIGAGGLGEFINRGLALSDTRLIMLGAVPSALLALYVSFAVAALERGLDERKRRGIPLLAGPRGRFLSFVPLVLLLLFTLWGYLPGISPSAPQIKVGSKNFTEQLVLAELIAQRIEEETGLRVERKFNLGGTMICHGALMEGEIDLYPEYTGTAMLAILENKRRITDPDRVYDLVSRRYDKDLGLKWLEPFGFNNTYAIAVRGTEAKQRGWKKISDLKSAAPRLHAGFTAEFSERPDGYPGLREAYGITFGVVSDLDPAIMYDAIRQREVDIIAAFATDSRIPRYGLKLLKDNRHFFPPYYAAPVIRKDTLKKYPQVEEALEPLGGLIDEQTMQQLNYEVDQNHRPVRNVVREFLKKKKLL